MRMQKVVKWYLSGLYKKPKGLKKPYNPILGETFRCYWQHPTGSKASSKFKPPFSYTLMEYRWEDNT